MRRHGGLFNLSRRPARAEAFDGGSIMGSKSTKTITTPTADWHLMCDDDILRLLLDQGPRTVAEMADHFHVTRTTIRYRLIRLRRTRKVARKLVRSQTEPRRPTHLYSLTASGRDEAARCLMGTASTPKRRPMCDRDILRLLADQGPRSVAEMVVHFHVTETAIRLRLRADWILFHVSFGCSWTGPTSA